MNSTLRPGALGLSLLALSFAVLAQDIANWEAPALWSHSERATKAAVPTPPLPFVGITPCRVADTRGNGFSGQYGPPPLASGTPRNFTLAGQCGIPGSAEAVSLNLTVTNTLGPGFILVHPEGGTQPTVSTLNYVAGQTAANAAIISLGSAGGITVIAGVSGTDLIIDANGYYGGSIQSRVTGTCLPGSSISTINSDGTVVCEADDDTTYSAGSGLSLSGTTFSLNTNFTDSLYWRLGGNVGTSSASHFLGTLDAQPLELRVAGTRALRLEPRAISPNIIGGFEANSANLSTSGATIAGGGFPGFPNRVVGSFGTVSGGRGNDASDSATVGGGVFNKADGLGSTVSGGDLNVAGGFRAFVGGGLLNRAGGTDSVVGGGSSNSATAQNAFVGGGLLNIASGTESTIGGGLTNLASGIRATIAGGVGNLAAGDLAVVLGGVNNQALGLASFAGGVRASAIHPGSFVWADDVNFDFVSERPRQFSARATGGARFVSAVDGAGGASAGVEVFPGGGAWSSLSDRNAKANHVPANQRQILDLLAAIPIEIWNYKSQDPSIRHIGPMAEDFYAAFHVGEDEKRITTTDADGVALAAIQALYAMVRERDLRIRSLEKRLSALEARDGGP